MRYDFENERLFISADELSYYAYRRENATVLSEKYGFIKNVITSNEKGHSDHSLNEEERLSAVIRSIADSYSENIDSTHTEVALSLDSFCGEHDITVGGLADIISFDGVLHTVEMIKTVRKITPALSPFSEPDFFAKSSLFAYMFSKETGVSEIKIKLTFISKGNGDRASFTALFSVRSLERMFSTLLSRAEPFILEYINTQTVLPDEINDMPFPYPSIREGQEEFIKAAYRTIKRGENLLVSAPTGIGKTMSALFPAVKSLGTRSADKIFYLTAKTITGRAALEAARLLVKQAPTLKVCMILSKEMTCPFKKKFGAPGTQSACFSCVKTDSVYQSEGLSLISYREREVCALTELLKSDENVFTPEIIRKTADDYSVCPYELSLDLSELCQIIVCDCNYVIDDNVRFRRYFKRDGNTDRYVFLFDEAHNLPDRTRNTYSSSVSLSEVNEMFSIIENEFADHGNIYDTTVMLVRVLEQIRDNCTDSEYTKQTEYGEIQCGYFEDKTVPDDFAKCVSTLVKQLSALCRESDAAEMLGKYYSVIFKLTNSINVFDERFRFFCSREGEDVKVQLLCIDPAGILEKMLSSASSVIMFSATLSPIEYFTEVMGMKNAATLELQSPYESDNLCLVSYDSVSTRFSDRAATAEDCAEVIYTAISAREGNYIVYFPSYDYMKKVCRSFARVARDCGIVMQKPGMSYRERQRFIDIFHEKRAGTVVGFCVLGGMFSEGIDLAGESLIGTIIIGCGMPQLSAERNIMAAYYDEKTERGKEFAYICPGMNKVLQAAGRVIRSENDRGIIVLVDDRLNDPNMKMLFPPHWRHMKYTSNLPSLSAILDEFWNT